MKQGYFWKVKKSVAFEVYYKIRSIKFAHAQLIFFSYAEKGLVYPLPRKCKKIICWHDETAFRDTFSCHG